MSNPAGADTPEPTDALTEKVRRWFNRYGELRSAAEWNPGSSNLGAANALVSEVVAALRTRFAGHLAGGPAEPSENENNGHGEQAEDAYRLALLLDAKRLKGTVVLSDDVASDVQVALEDAANAHRLLALPRPAPVSGGAPDPLVVAAKAIVDEHGYGAKAGKPDYVAFVSCDKIENLKAALELRAGGASENPSEDVRTAVARVLEGFDSGVFVRDTSGDFSPGWHKRIAPYVAAITTLGKFVEVRAVGGATPGAPAKEG